MQYPYFPLTESLDRLEKETLALSKRDPVTVFLSRQTQTGQPLVATCSVIKNNQTN
jgi:hypothetical protein